MCTVLLPLGVNPIAVNKYIILYHIISYYIALQRQGLYFRVKEWWTLTGWHAKMEGSPGLQNTMSPPCAMMNSLCLLGGFARSTTYDMTHVPVYRFLKNQETRHWCPNPLVLLWPMVMHRTVNQNCWTEI